MSEFSMALNTEEWVWVLVLFVWVSYETWSMRRGKGTRGTQMERGSFLVACMSSEQRNRVYYWSRERRNLETKLICLPSWRPQRKLIKANKLENNLKDKDKDKVNLYHSFIWLLCC